MQRDETTAASSVQDALAPYKHIEEDLKSLKEVLEMKNQQIHQQELKISELEKIVGFKFCLCFRFKWFCTLHFVYKLININL